uniref:Uncharacterized protein n=1 Tax=Pyramimonas obovata TaxID=1411642 RepID=A0A7S0RNS0_9CHLO|mmetsp:Transcript_38753/g.84311  ORF Transcript_38753/g.84311 Transcript_38753/m.84311 type:complete len:421 (+) Transcript_38753:125-1387(+)
MAGPVYIESSSDEEEVEDVEATVPESSTQTSAQPSAQSGDAPATSKRQESTATPDVARIVQLEKELDEARKAQRTLAAKLIDSGGTSSKDDEVSSGTIAGTIRGLEGELDILRRNLEFRNKQVAAAAQQMQRMQQAVEEAKARAAEIEAAQGVADSRTEEEVQQLQEELRAYKARSEAVLTRQQCELEALRQAKEEQQQAEQAAVVEARELAAREWRQKMEAIEQQWKGKVQEKEVEVTQLSKTLEGVKEKVEGDNALSAKYATVSMESSQVKAEFDSFKAMTRRIISQKDEELSRLRRLEESAEAAMMAGATAVRGTVASISQAAKETKLLQAVQTRLSDGLQNVDAGSLRGRAMAAGILLLIAAMAHMLYHTYLSAGSLVCFLDIIGLKLGAGCAGTAAAKAATLANRKALVSAALSS